MYYDFCHFQGDPFAQTPDPAFLYLSPSHKAAVHALSSGIAARQELMALFGAPGLGKTTILRTCQARMPPRSRLIFLDYPKLSFRDVLVLMSQECGLACATDTPTAMLSQLYQAAREQLEQGWHMVLLIDEAHQLPVPTLESFPRLLRLRAATGGPLFQLVLAGLPALRHTLRLPQLRALKERLAVSLTLSPLTAAESRAYIRHRLTKVHLREDGLFTPGALRRIIRAARGNPRVLNTLCSTMLMGGSSGQQKPISARIARDVIAAVGAKRSRPYRRWGGAVAAGLLLVAGSGWGWQSQWLRGAKAGPLALSPLTRRMADMPRGSPVAERSGEVPGRPRPEARVAAPPEAMPERTLPQTGPLASAPGSQPASAPVLPQAPAPTTAQAPQLLPGPEQEVAGRALKAPVVPRQAQRDPASASPREGQARGPEGGTVWPHRAPVAPHPPAATGQEPAAFPGPSAPSLRGGQGETRGSREMQDRTTAHDRAAFTLAGEWMVVNTVEETTYAAYKNLRVAFRLVIRQQGETFEAEGEKYLENGQSLPVAARSPITIQGTLAEGAVIEATFREAGRSRPTHGRFRLTRLSPTQLRGTFATTAADASGSSQWLRVQ